MKKYPLDQTYQRIDKQTTIMPNGCWMFGKWKKYRPLMSVSGVHFDVRHLVLAKKLNAPLDKDLRVLVTCGSIWCINPDHLTSGTYQEMHLITALNGRIYNPVGRGPYPITTKPQPIPNYDWDLLDSLLKFIYVAQTSL